MNFGGSITKDLARLLDLLAPHCADRETFDWLRAAVDDKGRWRGAHGVYGHISNKQLTAERLGRKKESAQYRFEAMCAKTLYNLSGADAPFDADSPYWIVPTALAFARQSDVDERHVLSCVTLPGV